MLILDYVHKLFDFLSCKGNLEGLSSLLEGGLYLAAYFFFFFFFDCVVSIVAVGGLSSCGLRA